MGRCVLYCVMKDLPDDHVTLFGDSETTENTI
jgi:hypothetical protein